MHGVDTSSLTIEELFKAYKDCQKNKRNTMSELCFEFYQEENLYKLYRELKDCCYTLAYSICFVILYPKVREVWAANFRDRIVHHFIYNAISPVFYKRFVQDTFSCIPERGTGKAKEKIEKYVRQITKNYTIDAYYLKADIKNFFVSIDKEILFGQIKKYIKNEMFLALCEIIIFNDPREKVYIQSPKWKFDKLPEYKSLWHTNTDKGLPIGNLTSQFFSNVYLNELDQYVKHKLKCKYYCRYVDDIIILDTDPHKLDKIHKELRTFLQNRLKLELHEHKKEINKIFNGIDFVGYNIKPHRTFLRQKTIRRIFKTIKKHHKSNYDIEEIHSYIRTINSYLGMLRGVNGYRMRKTICIQSVNLFIGCDDKFTKLFCRIKSD